MDSRRDGFGRPVSVGGLEQSIAPATSPSGSGGPIVIASRSHAFAMNARPHRYRITITPIEDDGLLAPLAPALEQVNRALERSRGH